MKNSHEDAYLARLLAQQPETPVRETIAQKTAMLRMQHEKHQRRWHIWEKMLPAGGMIICTSWGAAMNERQALYNTRKTAQQAYGTTPFDDFVIRLKNGDHRLEVGFGQVNVTEIIPYGEGAPINNGPYIVPREREEPPTDITCPICHNPLSLGEHGEGKCERSRAPMGAPQLGE
jgi:hypothetical protein